MQADEQKRRLLKFLDVIQEVSQQQESFQSMCQKGQEAAATCTNSAGSALYVRQDASQTDLMNLQRALVRYTFASHVLYPKSSNTLIPCTDRFQRIVSQGTYQVSPEAVAIVELSNGSECMIVQER